MYALHATELSSKRCAAFTVLESGLLLRPCCRVRISAPGDAKSDACTNLFVYTHFLHVYSAFTVCGIEYKIVQRKSLRKNKSRWKAARTRRFRKIRMSFGGD